MDFGWCCDYIHAVKGFERYIAMMCLVTCALDLPHVNIAINYLNLRLSNAMSRDYLLNLILKTRPT